MCQTRGKVVVQIRRKQKSDSPIFQRISQKFRGKPTSRFGRVLRALTLQPMQFEAHQPEHHTNATSQSWPAPLTMFIAWLAALLARITRLNTIRRTTKFKSTWRDNWPGLRQSEWHRDLMLTQGAALLLSGKTLDDADFVDHPMPADYGGPCPKSPYEMKRRFAVIADWLRDPEAHIHRHAARIAKRAALTSEPRVALMLSSDRRELCVHREPVEGSNHAGGLANARAPPNSPRLPIACGFSASRV